MAVTVRMRRVARPYTVHPAGAKDRLYQTGLTSGFRRKPLVNTGSLEMKAWLRSCLQVGRATKCSLELGWHGVPAFAAPHLALERQLVWSKMHWTQSQKGWCTCCVYYATTDELHKLCGPRFPPLRKEM